MSKMVLKALFYLVLIAGIFVVMRYFFIDSGYVLISYNGYILESSLWSTLAAIVLALVVSKLLFSILRAIINGTGWLFPITAKSRHRKAQRVSNKGLIQFANGYWNNAEKLLGQAGDTGSSPLLNYLLAARAASFNNDLDASQEFLRKADQATPAASMAIGITQAEIQMSHNHLEQALATLSSLRKRSPKHPYILKLLQQTYQQLGDWQALASLLPVLHRQKVLNGTQLEQLEQTVYHELFLQALNKGCSLSPERRTEPADAIWNSLTNSQRKNEDLVLSYARCLYKLNAQDAAETFIRRQLGSMYSPLLIHIYGKLNGNDANRQLIAGEKLLTERPNDPELLLALGRISARAQLWGKARDYLETSLQLHNSAATYNELGQLLAHLGEHEKSSGYFQQGLALASEKS